MAEILDAALVRSGTWGSLWLDGEQVAECYGCQIKLSKTKEDVARCRTLVAGKKLTGISGTGHAVVAITDASDNILWSYHIWVPEINPTTDDNLLTYAIPATSIGSGSTYQVMPIALGAMNKASVTTSGTGDNTTNPQSFGLYYQWGRKDPLGRPSTVTASGDSYVATTFYGLSGITK